MTGPPVISLQGKPITIGVDDSTDETLKTMSEQGRAPAPGDRWPPAGRHGHQADVARALSDRKVGDVLGEISED